ncbi:hypothetical protein [Longitalea luteola]|uniref:hypothetical protein n=1 Tax=Longitalea luteola TaxID=2812563 RepID=UPI001A9650F0|nr:hypothetical protein [Longitalea luteola]
MKNIVKGVCLFAMACIFSNVVNAQENDKRTEVLKLQPQRAKISSANFSNVEVIDTRRDPDHLGYIQKGGFNRKETLVLTQPLKDEIASVVTKLLDGANKKDGTLLINIRHFNVSELTGYMTEKGTFEWNAGFYIKQGSDYRFLFSIDSTVTVKAGGLDVTTRLLDTVPEVLAGYINQAATFDLSKAGTRPYTADDIQHIDELEKKEIPVYNVDIPKKGLYLTYDDFKNNRPSREDIIVYHKKGFSRPFVYEMKENDKKGKEIPSKSYYVVCDGEKMYIGRPRTLYALTKTNGDFYFTGIGKDEADMGTMILAGALGGLAGGIAGSHDTAIFEFKIDHLTGKFIPVKKIKD